MVGVMLEDLKDQARHKSSYRKSMWSRVDADLMAHNQTVTNCYSYTLTVYINCSGTASHIRPKLYYGWDPNKYFSCYPGAYVHSCLFTLVTENKRTFETRETSKVAYRITWGGEGLRKSNIVS